MKKKGKKYPVKAGGYLKGYTPVATPLISTGRIPSIFGNNNVSSSHATRDGRIHCVAVQRTAIYKDACGNKIILKEDTQTMNTPETFRNKLEFHGGTGTKWKKY